jgi:hypothetical protein
MFASGGMVRQNDQDNAATESIRDEIVEDMARRFGWKADFVQEKRTNMPPCDALQWELPSKETMLKRLDKNLDETAAAGHERFVLA